MARKTFQIVEQRQLTKINGHGARSIPDRSVNNLGDYLSRQVIPSRWINQTKSKGAGLCTFPKVESSQQIVNGFRIVTFHIRHKYKFGEESFYNDNLFIDFQNNSMRNNQGNK
jgi:hypothetical protein